MYTLCITWADHTDLANVADEAVLVSGCEGFAYAEIANDLDFQAWARANGCTAIEIWEGKSILRWSKRL